jgi:hypothetical protein
MEGDWTINATGTIVHVDKENVDKSGRHPKFVYQFLIHTETAEATLAGAHLPTDLAVHVRDQELLRIAGELLVVGDRVAIAARANGPNPAFFYLTGARKLAVS